MERLQKVGCLPSEASAVGKLLSDLCLLAWIPDDDGLHYSAYYEKYATNKFME